jgi:hypothetical protein
MIPQSQAYIRTYLTYQKDLRGAGQRLSRWSSRTSMATSSIPRYVEVLKQVNDELFVTTRAWIAPG